MPRFRFDSGPLDRDPPGVAAERGELLQVVAKVGEQAGAVARARARPSRSQVDQSAAGATPSAETAEAVTPFRNIDGSAVGKDAAVEDHAVADTGLEEHLIAFVPDVDVEAFAGDDRRLEAAAHRPNPSGSPSQSVEQGPAAHSVRAEAVQDRGLEAGEGGRMTGPSAGGCGRR